MEIFQILFVIPITNLLVGFYQMFTSLHIPYALGFSIIALTAFIRLILYPFTSAQIKATYKMQKIAPHLANIKEKHKGDQKRQQEEMMKLYKEHGVNPAAGCLPTLIQLPVIWSLYSVLINTVGSHSLESISKINKVLYFPVLHVNNVWDTGFFGLPLFETPAKLISQNPLIILVPVLTGVFQFVLSKMMMPENPPQNTKKDDFQSAFQTQSMYIFPVMIGFFSYTLPIGLSLYWNTFTLFGILQQYILQGPGALRPWIEKMRPATNPSVISLPGPAKKGSRKK